jgi:hypothetical protein
MIGAARRFGVAALLLRLVFTQSFRRLVKLNTDLILMDGSIKYLVRQMSRNGESG